MTQPSTFLFPPKIIHAWISIDNVNDLISAHFTGEIDLLSLDMDGVDWWIWEKLDVISPRVVILEFNNVLGPERSITIPYNKSFSASNEAYGVSYCGASLSAFNKLSKQKGYRLIGVEKYGFNAIFMRNDVGINYFPEVNPNECFFHPFAKYSVEKRYNCIKDMEWIEV